jgi:hypothetical protein
MAMFFLLGGETLVYIRQTYPELRASALLVKDLVIGFATIVGILLAVEGLRRNSKTHRMSQSMRFTERWNAPTMFDSKTAWRHLHDDLRAKSSEDRTAKLQDERVRARLPWRCSIFLRNSPF